MNNYDNINYIITGYLLQHDDIISLDFHKSGAKVRRNFDIGKDAGGTGQNLICKSLSIRGVVSASLGRITNTDTPCARIANPTKRRGGERQIRPSGDNKASATYTYTAYTDPEYQGVTSQVPYTGGYTDTYTGKSFNKFFCVTYTDIGRHI